MIPRHVLRCGRELAGMVCCVIAVTASCFASDPPKPTPRPGTLGAYAETVTLNRAALGHPAERLVLTNDNVAHLGRDGTLILGAVDAVGCEVAPKSHAADVAERNRWRAAHRKQQQVIARLEQRRAQLEIEIDHIGSLRLTVKTMARLQLAEAKLRDLERQISAAQEELSRIVREARRRGAEPGWFR